MMVAVVTVLSASAYAAGPGDGEDPAQAESRFSFAQRYLGLSLSVVPNPGIVDLAPGSMTSNELDLPTMLAPRLVVGGLHFWEHADLYVSFAPYWFRTSKPDGTSTRFSLGLEAGVKIYPWALAPGTLRPFGGVAWSVNSYRQGDGPTITRHQMPVMLGAAWRTTFGMFEVGASFHLLGASSDYSLERDQAGRFQPQVLDFWLSYRYLFDSTREYINESRSGRLLQRYIEFEKEGRLSAWEIALGPSSAFPFTGNEFSGDGAFLSDLKRPTFAPDIAVGYYWHQIDAVVRANYRFFYSSDDGYGRKHTYTRHSLSVDAVKFIVDYQGFLPFVGGGISLERLDYEVDDDRIPEERSFGQYKAGLSLIVGWDVRPYESSSWVLRTNLRFTPGLDLRTGGDKVAFDYIEFNFFQLVLYPERLF